MKNRAYFTATAPPAAEPFKTPIHANQMTCDLSVNRVEILIVVLMSPDFYIPKMKTALFVAPEFTDFLVLVLCNVHIRLHQESTTRANNSDFPLWMEIACSPLYCHRKFTVEISWNFVMSVTTVLSFSYIQKKSWEIFNFLWRHKSSDLHTSKSRMARQPRVLSQ